MRRYIDAEIAQKFFRAFAASKEIEPFSNINWETAYRVAADCIDDIPTADVEPVRHAHWYKDERFIKQHYFCSLCNGSALKNSHAEYNVLSPFCPRCGAKMDKKEEKK